LETAHEVLKQAEKDRTKAREGTSDLMKARSRRLRPEMEATTSSAFWPPTPG